MNFTQAIASCMSNYFTFSGRATRSEFWWFYLFTVLMSWGASIVGVALYGDGVVFANIVSLVFMFPSLAVSARRLHDIGRSGWWLLIAFTIVGFILLIVWWATATKNEDAPVVDSAA